MGGDHPFEFCAAQLDGKKYYSLDKLGDARVHALPYSIRVLLEAAIRNCDNFEVTEKDVETILNWHKTSKQQVEIAHKPARVVLQDFTGVPAVVDLAAMRDATARLGGDPQRVNPLCPADLVIDHSVQVDHSRSAGALEKNEEIEFERNNERFSFLKWGAKAFDNFRIIPPGSGIVHQVNLEYLARVVFERNGLLYPDSCVGTDSHTTMIDGLGVVGWGVGGIEAEAVMLGQPISMVLPEVVGYRLVGHLRPDATATDLVLTITNALRKRGVVGKFVEFFGHGAATLSLADRATIANMSPEYGATMGYFAVDEQTLAYLRETGRSADHVQLIEDYFKANHLFADHANNEIDYSGDVMTLDLSSIVPCVSGPKRPHDRVAVSDMPSDFASCLASPVGFKGFAVENAGAVAKFSHSGQQFELRHGSVVLCAITSCTNTSNPNVMLGAGLIARNAVAKGLRVRPYIKTSLSPGSGAVDAYFKKSNLLEPLEKLGFFTAGFGCQTCIGNSGDLDEEVCEAISSSDLVAAAVLSGNRNFEGRVHPLTRANYLASPLYVVAYALAGRLDVNFETEPLGVDEEGNEVFLRDIWPDSAELARTVKAAMEPEMFKTVYAKVEAGSARWNALEAPEGALYSWDAKSTYIHNPPFFQTTTKDAPEHHRAVKDAYCLLNLGDSITTDHISPAGKIAKNSPAGRYLTERGVAVKDFNSLGARRGNDQVMARGTFANIRLVNKLNNNQVGPKTLHVPSGTVMDVFDVAMKYKEAGAGTIVLAGSEYGSGSSRDWAAKGPYLQGVQAVVAKSYERIHRSNLVGMGILPLQFPDGVDADSLGLTGKERFSIDNADCTDKCNKAIKVTTDTGVEFEATTRLDTDIELTYYKHGGILQYVLRKLASAK